MFTSLRAVFLLSRFQSKQGVPGVVAHSENHDAAPVRMFTVKAGDEEYVLNHLRLADRTLVDRGIVIVENCFSHKYPEVLSVVAAFLKESTLTPFAITPKKLYFARPQYSQTYADMLASSFKVERTGSVFGHPVVIFR
jgi:hypothetical protein